VAAILVDFLWSAISIATAQKIRAATADARKSAATMEGNRQHKECYGGDNAPYVNWFDNARPNFNANDVRNRNPNYGSGSRGTAKPPATPHAASRLLHGFASPAAKHASALLQRRLERVIFFFRYNICCSGKPEQYFERVISSHGTFENWIFDLLLHTPRLHDVDEHAEELVLNAFAKRIA